MALTDSTNPMQGVSGPGKFAKRSDLEYKPDSYGEGVEMAAIKSGAPLARAEATPKARASDVREAASQTVTPLFADSQRPNEEITTGVDIGPGEGSTALGMNKTQMKLSDSLALMLPFDTTGEIAILYQDALAQGN